MRPTILKTAFERNEKCIQSSARWNEVVRVVYKVTCTFSRYLTLLHWKRTRKITFSGKKALEMQFSYDWATIFEGLNQVTCANFYSSWLIWSCISALKSAKRLLKQKSRRYESRCRSFETFFFVSRFSNGHESDTTAFKAVFAQFLLLSKVGTNGVSPVSYWTKTAAYEFQIGADF